MVVGQRSHKQKTLSVTQNNYGPIRGMFVGEGGRSTGFYCNAFPVENSYDFISG